MILSSAAFIFGFGSAQTGLALPLTSPQRHASRKSFVGNSTSKLNLSHTCTGQDGTVNASDQSPVQRTIYVGPLTSEKTLKSLHSERISYANDCYKNNRLSRKLKNRKKAKVLLFANMATITQESASTGYVFDIDVERWRKSESAVRPFPFVAEPQEIACYSKSDDGEIAHGSRSQLKRYSPPVGENIDLNIGYDTFVPKSHEDNSIENVVRAVKAQQRNALKTCHIMTYRNNLNKIGQTLTNMSDAWELDCCQVGNCVFLDIRKINVDAANDVHRRLMYTGYRFEAICTNEADKPVNANSEFCSITSCKIADHSIILSSEIDCTLGNPANRENAVRDYVELKTMKAVEVDRELRNMYKYRFPKFWIQSFFAGVPTIMLGLRTRENRMSSITTLDVQQIPVEANDFFQGRRERPWQPSLLMNFVDDVLTTIRDACARHVGCTIRVVYDPVNRRIQATTVSGPESGLFPGLSVCLKG